MNLALVVLVCVSAVYAAPFPSDGDAQIVRSEFEQQPEGGYVYSFETNNGIQRQESGELKQALDEDNKPHDVVVVRGSYSYPDAEGKPQTVTYTADETGYHAEGETIPKSLSRQRRECAIIVGERICN